MTGGFTEALKLAVQAKAMGFELIVGNMPGLWRAMAPAYVIAQRCLFAIDRNWMLDTDRDARKGRNILKE